MYPRLAPRFALALASLGFGASAAGCSADVGTGQDAGSSQRLALVEVRVQQSPEGVLARFDASARFVSVREPGAPADALELLGLAWKPVPAGTCVAVGEPSAPTASVRVELRDLSPVGLELKGDDGAATKLQLEPRTFPDVAGLVSGVVFVAPAEAPLGMAPKTAVVKAGTVSLGGLELPDLPQLLDAVPDNGTYTVSRSLDVAVPPVREGDRLVIDVVRGGVTKLRCGMDAQGKLRIDLGAPGEASLLVRSQRRVLRDDAALGAVDARLERDIELKLLVK